MSQKRNIEEILTAFMVWKNHNEARTTVTKDELVQKLSELFHVTKLRKSEAKKKAKFVISKRIDGQFMFNLVAPNGEIIATSEGYKSRQGCSKGIDAIQRYAENAIIEDLTDVK